MRIAYVSADRGVIATGRNGSATHVREMINALIVAGLEVTLLSPNVGGDPGLKADVVPIETESVLTKLRKLMPGDTGDRDDDMPTPEGVQVSELRGLALNHEVLERLEALHARWPIEAIYERQSLWGWAGLQFAERHGVPFLLEVNAPLVDQQEEYRTLHNAAAARALERLQLSEATRIVVPSRALVSHVTGRGGRTHRVRVIPCGVSREGFATPAPPRTPDGTFTIGFLGSLKPWHGIDTLIRAFIELHASDPTYRLLVVGDGPLIGELTALRATHPDAVTLTGAVPHDEVPRWLAKMDVGVAPYPQLPLFYFSPLKLFEYAAAGVPIAAAETGQIAEVFTHRETAMLHEPGRATKLAKHIERLRSNPDGALRMARRARAVVLRGYTWDRLAGRMVRMIAAAARQTTRKRAAR